MAKSGSSLKPVYLFIDGVSSRDLTLTLVSRDGVFKKKLIKDGTRTEKLLPEIATFLAGGGVAGITVAQGGGSFSQTRIICSVANALAYGWGIKVTAVASKLTAEQVIKKLPKLRWQRIILPKYSGPGVH